MFVLIGYGTMITPPRITFEEFIDPLLFITYIALIVVVNSIFIEVIYRRTVIPLLEDRGSSPFHAVLLASFGDCFISIPVYILSLAYPQMYGMTYIDILFAFIFSIQELLS